MSEVTLNALNASPRVPLGDLLSVIRGVSYKKEDASNQPSSESVPVIRATNIQSKLIFEGLVYVPRKYVSDEQLLRPNDIVVAASSGSRHIVGKAAQLTHDWYGSFGAFCFGLRPTSDIHPRYLNWFLQTPEYRNRVSELSAGVNINNLRAKHIQEIDIPLPDIEIQQHIVEEIEKQFTRLDAGVAALQRAQANLKRYRAAVLKAACEGKLVPTEAEVAHAEGRSYERGAELLQRLSDERRQQFMQERREYLRWQTNNILDSSGSITPSDWLSLFVQEMVSWDVDLTHPELIKNIILYHFAVVKRGNDNAALISQMMDWVATANQLLRESDVQSEVLSKPRDIRLRQHAYDMSGILGQVASQQRLQSLDLNEFRQNLLIKPVKEKMLRFDAGIQVIDHGNLPELPEGWAWTTLYNIAEVKGGVTKDSKKRQFADYRMVPYLRVANVQRGYLDLTEVKEIAASETEINELALKKDDILFNEGGDRDKLGRGWIWNDELPLCIHQNHVFRARLRVSDIEPKFVSWYANSSGQQFFFDQGKHTTNLASISLSKLVSLPVPIPPAAEQLRIVAEVERQLSIIDEMEAAVLANLQRGRRLRQSILQKAFNGELVTDAPAEIF